jgi:predicted kinase
MKPLSFPDSPDETFIKYVVEPKALKCAADILQQAEGWVRQGREVVLDVATFEKRYRDLVRDWARRADAEFVLYWIRASREVRRKRVLDRNRDKGNNFSFNVPEWAFDYMDAKFEAPTASENPVIVDTDGV